MTYTQRPNHPSRPPQPVLVASDGPARHEVLQVLRAGLMDGGMLTGSALQVRGYLEERDDAQPDSLTLLATHEVQAGLWELTYLAFWRTDQERT